NIQLRYFQQQKLKINHRACLKLSLAQSILRRTELQGVAWLETLQIFYFLQSCHILVYWSFIEQMKL
ncbi:hypothetical protein QQ73_09455, partial [Candidatus Endoriftia persephone str. Guaymas]|nr:hypothetical protein [Candidatus Endoriftia persephone str. Guaymas]